MYVYAAPLLRTGHSKKKGKETVRCIVKDRGRKREREEVCVCVCRSVSSGEQKKVQGGKGRAHQKKIEKEIRLDDQSPLDGIDEPEPLPSVDEEVRVGVCSGRVGQDLARKWEVRTSRSGRVRTGRGERGGGGGARGRRMKVEAKG